MCGKHFNSNHFSLWAIINGDVFGKAMRGNLLRTGKKALDRCVMEVGRMVAEAIMLWDREEVSGKEYQPEEGYQKWGWRRGSSYEKMKNALPFSEYVFTHREVRIFSAKFRRPACDKAEQGKGE